MTQLTTKKIYIIAGEASGDLHGSNLLKEFIQQNNECNSPLNLQFRYWGGDKMEEAIGQKPIKHFKLLLLLLRVFVC